MRKFFKIRTHDIGYKGVMSTLVEVDYSIKTVESDFLPELLGGTVDVVEIEKLAISNMANLAATFSDDDILKLRGMDAKGFIERHIGDIVREYIRTGSSLIIEETKGK